MNQQEALATVTSEHCVTIGTAELKAVIEANPRRVALVFAGVDSGTYWAQKRDTLNPATGLLLHGITPGPSNPMILSRVLHGSLVTGAWLAYRNSGSDELFYSEVLEQ